MNTNWLSPTSITYTTDPNHTNSDWTDWLSEQNNLSFPVLTKKNMRRIALHDTAQTVIFADTLVLKGFNIPAYTTLLGIQVSVTVRRQARITDYLVQMHLNGVPFTSNLATQDPNAPNTVVYGSSTELWGIPPGTNIADPNFGVLIQVGPHPTFPGNDEAVIDNVSLQVFYS